MHVCYGPPSFAMEFGMGYVEVRDCSASRAATLGGHVGIELEEGSRASRQDRLLGHGPGVEPQAQRDKEDHS